MGLTLFKKKQRLQGGSEAVPSDLPTPPEPPEAYQSAPVRSLIDQVRQGILPDEDLEQIKQDPTSLRSLAAMAGAALSAGTLLSGGEGHGVEMRYPKISSETVSGMRVRPEIPNQASISAELGQDYETLPGIREVKMSDFPGITGKHYSTDGNAKIASLADQIHASGEINPLIVVHDESGQGPYILEGATRVDALKRLGKETFPAQVVIDTSEAGNKPHQYARGTKGVTGYGPRHILNI